MTDSVDMTALARRGLEAATHNDTTVTRSVSERCTALSSGEPPATVQHNEDPGDPAVRKQTADVRSKLASKCNILW